MCWKEKAEPTPARGVANNGSLATPIGSASVDKVTQAVGTVNKKLSLPLATVKNSNRADTKSQGFNPSTAAATIKVADFLDVVNHTHQSILSENVLHHMGEARNPSGFYTGKAKFSLKDSATLAQEIVRIQKEGVAGKRTDAEIQADIRVGAATSRHRCRWVQTLPISGMSFASGIRHLCCLATYFHR